jgi:hypothetical protein
MPPALPYIGMLDSGADALTLAPPAAGAPVQKSYQLPAGKYTLRLVAPVVVTGLTRSAGPNMNWFAMFRTLASPGKSNGSARVIV